MPKKFERKIENFTCEHCEAYVEGDGYTNHCPKCLWSKHVDVNPGDRLETCGGMMKPISIIKEGKGWGIVHQCQKCGFEKKNKMSAGDDFTEMLRVAKENL